MKLNEYRKKRQFAVTTEPHGSDDSHDGDGSLLYAIQKHMASHLHYDLRLQWSGILLSWAVPKGPSLDPAVKRLAMRTEDHPVEYGDFEGVIPAGQYGAGTVMLWDQGTWHPEDADVDSALQRGEIKFTLRARNCKERGSWFAPAALGIMIRLAAYQTPRPICIREGRVAGRATFCGQPASTCGDCAGRRRRHRESFAGRSVRQGANRDECEIRLGAHQANKAADLKNRIPFRVQPMLATLVAGPFDRAGWVYEEKYDGDRMLAYKEGDRVRLLSRNGKDKTDSFPRIASGHPLSQPVTLLLDGEVVVFDKKGVSRFQLLQQEKGEPVYAVFDCLFHNGKDLRARAPVRAARSMERSIGSSKVLLPSHRLASDGLEAFRIARSWGYEGLVAKDLSVSIR